MTQVFVCRSCGTENTPESAFCMGCGTKMDYKHVDIIRDSSPNILENRQPIRVVTKPVPVRPPVRQLQRKRTFMLNLVLAVNWMYLIAISFVVGIILFIYWLFKVNISDLSGVVVILFVEMGILALFIVFVNERLKNYNQTARLLNILFIISQFYYLPKVFLYFGMNLTLFSYILCIVQLYALILDRETSQEFSKSRTISSQRYGFSP